MEIITIIEQHAHHFLQEVRTEGEGEKEAIIILRKYIKDGKITEEEEHIFRTQLADSFKIIGIGVPFVLIPGASIIMPILIKVAAKHNIALMPSAFVDKEYNKQNPSKDQ